MKKINKYICGVLCLIIILTFSGCKANEENSETTKTNYTTEIETQYEESTWNSSTKSVPGATAKLQSSQD